MKSSVFPVVIAVLAIVIARTSPAFAGSPWIQYGFDAAHSSFNDTETILTRHNVSDLAFRWGANVGVSVPTAPIVGGGRMFVASDGNIFAFDAKTGMPLWSHLSCSGEDTVQPALGKHGLFVGDAGGDLAAYDPATGVQLWCDDESGSITSAPAVHGNTVYITNGGDVVAVDQGTGAHRWEFTNAGPLTGTPAIANGVVYVTGGNSVFALNKNTGQQIWRKNLGFQANISAPSVSNGTVYVGGTGLYALSAFDGQILWRTFTVGVNVSTPAIANNKVYVNSEDPNFGLHAFNATTGALVWQNYPDETEVTVTVANGVVYDVDADTGELVMLNSDTGIILGTLVDPDGHPFSSSPFGAQVAIANGRVFVSTGDFSGANRVDSFRLP